MNATLTTENFGNLSSLKNVGPVTLSNFTLLGIETIQQLAKQDADRLFARLSGLSKDRVDPCVQDIFSAAIHQARTGEALPWWSFSAARKQRQQDVSKDGPTIFVELAPSIRE